MTIASLANLIDTLIEGHRWFISTPSLLTTAAGCIVTPDASKELDVVSASTGGKMDDISFRGV
jgi:hypothetical protein